MAYLITAPNTTWLVLRVRSVSRALEIYYAGGAEKHVCVRKVSTRDPEAKYCVEQGNVSQP